MKKLLREYIYILAYIHNYIHAKEILIRWSAKLVAALLWSTLRLESYCRYLHLTFFKALENNVLRMVACF